MSPFGRELVESNLDHEVLFEDIVGEVTEELDSDAEIEFTADEIEEEFTDVEYYIERDGVPDPVVDSDVANGKDSKAPDAAK